MVDSESLLGRKIFRFRTHVLKQMTREVKGSKNASFEMTSFMDGPARYMEAGRLVFFMSKSGAPPPGAVPQPSRFSPPAGAPLLHRGIHVVGIEVTYIQKN